MLLASVDEFGSAEGTLCRCAFSLQYPELFPVPVSIGFLQQHACIAQGSVAVLASSLVPPGITWLHLLVGLNRHPVHVFRVTRCLKLSVTSHNTYYVKRKNSFLGRCQEWRTDHSCQPAAHPH